jgi:hypothetical protein
VGIECADIIGSRRGVCLPRPMGSSKCPLLYEYVPCITYTLSIAVVFKSIAAVPTVSNNPYVKGFR